MPRNFRSTFIASAATIGGDDPVQHHQRAWLFHGVRLRAPPPAASSRCGLCRKQAGGAGPRHSKTGTLESKDEIKRRIDEAAKFVPIDQLCLSPQCGFASSEEGNVLAEEEQWRSFA